MMSRGLRAEGTVEHAAWLGSRVVRAAGTVNELVPDGYESYVRLLHPLLDTDGRLVSWGTVAQETGGRVHPLVQWGALIGSASRNPRRGRVWKGMAPGVGSLPFENLPSLLRILHGHTSTPDDCFFGFYRGYNSISLRNTDRLTTGSPGTYALDSASLPFDAGTPVVAIGSVEHVLFRGHLFDAVSVDQSPNIFWPADRSWCVGTGIDHDSTLVAGARALAEALLEAPDLETLPIGLEDSMREDADRVNASQGG